MKNNEISEYLNKEENNRQYIAYGKYLVFDCDDPPDIQSVVQSAGGYALLISNHFFETWLLMHFENVTIEISKAETLRHLSDYLHCNYSMGREGAIREIIQKGDVTKAIDNAKELEQKHITDGKTALANIMEMNPYTSVHKLIEQFMVEISG